jgi:transcription elongation factor GreA
VTDVDLMTQEDYDELRAEIERLESVERAEIAQRIRVAREWGDLKENSEYHDAKNDQSMLETKILRLRERLLRAQIHTGETGGEEVGFGSRVTVVDENSGRELTYTLVAAVSADAAAGRLSIDSPVGRALTGAHVGDVVTVSTPKGDRRLAVTAVG